MELLSAIASTSVNQSVLETFDENQIFVNQSSQSLQSIVKIINEKLNSAKQRYEAVHYLNLLLSQSTLEIITDNYNQWMFYVLKACDTSNSSISFNVLRKLLLLTKLSPDLKKQCLSQHFNKVFDLLLSKDVTFVENIAALQCLEVTLLIFGGSCGQNKNAIEKYLLRYIDCDNNVQMKLVARCLHLLQQVSGGSVQGINHKIQWQKQQEKLCGTLHLLLNKLYESLDEIYSSSKDQETLELPELREDSNLIKYMNSVALRFCNVAQCLQNMLLTPFPAIKTVNVDAILNLVSRGLSVCWSDIVKNPSLDTLTLKTLISKIHTSLFEVLISLIECLGTNLLPYSVQLCNYFLKELSWIEKSGYYIPCRTLKITIYKCLNKWILVAKGGCSLHYFIKELTPIILRDVKSLREEVAPKVTLQKSSKHNSKKKNKNISENKLHSISMQRSITELNVRAEDISYWALKSLQNIFKYIGCFIEPHFHKMLQEFVVAQLLDMQQKQNNYYKSTQCCVELYRCLLITVLCPHPTLPPPIQYAVHIFSVGQTSRNESISKLCADALLSIDKILHPVCSTLNFPKDYYADKEFTKLTNCNEKRQEIIEIMEEPKELKEAKEPIEIMEDKEDEIINIEEDEVNIIEANETTHNNSGLDLDLKTLKQLDSLNNIEEIDSDYEMNLDNKEEMLNGIKQSNNEESDGSVVFCNNENRPPQNFPQNDDLVLERSEFSLKQKDINKDVIEINESSVDVGHRSKRAKIDFEIVDEEEEDMLSSFVNVVRDS